MKTLLQFGGPNHLLGPLLANIDTNGNDERELIIPCFIFFWGVLLI